MSARYAVTADYAGQLAYITTETDFNLKTRVVLQVAEPAAMSERAAELLAKIARKDNSLSNVQVIEVTA